MTPTSDQTPAQSLAAAVDHHTAGRMAEAEAIYRRILAGEPDNADALQLLGLLAHQCGNSADAVQLIQRAIGLDDAQAAWHNNLGEAYRALGKLQEAVLCYQRALSLAADFADAYVNLGFTLMDLGRIGDAEAAVRQVLEIRPRMVPALGLMGLVHRARGRVDEAVASFRQALELAPTDTSVLINLGSLLQDLGQVAEAIACYRTALETNPTSAAACNNMGLALTQLGLTEEATRWFSHAISLAPTFVEALNNLGNMMLRTDPMVAAEFYRRAVAVKPDHVNAWFNLGEALTRMSWLGEAETCYKRALGLDPRLALAHAGLANIRHYERRVEDALAITERALAMDPGCLQARWNRARALLLLGRYEDGWRDYECRLDLDRPRPEEFLRTQWDGRPLPGGTLLLRAEQGLGDTLQFVRFVATVAERSGARVVLEVQPPLGRCLGGLPGAAQVLVRGEPLPAFDAQCALGSLPGLLGVTLDTVPASVPYVVPDPGLVDHWRDRLPDAGGAGSPRRRIGLAWAGNPGHAQDLSRSMALSQLAPLLEVPGLHIVSLQKGPGAEQAHADGLAGRLTPLGEAFTDLADTAAVMASLDLVITVDTAVAHLAGALGRPVWVLLSHVPDWRWGLEGDRSPWYPSARLFRQPTAGDWTTVVEEVVAALKSGQ
ncbi:MAG: tetratricopeptide repeat protein [Alphaproteobacteria bacterium]